MNSQEPNIYPSTGQFVDPLFAIFIAAAVSETIVNWTNNGLSGVSYFELCVVFVGFFNILLSWFGYHKSVTKKPIKGSLRFIVTVILLPLYMLTIILYDRDFFNIAVIYASIFFLWSFWEYLRDIEYDTETSFRKLMFKFYNIIIYATIILLFIAEKISDNNKDAWYIIYADETALGLIIFSILSLRISKSAAKEESPVAKIIAEIMNLLFGDRDRKT